jgi:hypothetical protein
LSFFHPSLHYCAFRHHKEFILTSASITKKFRYGETLTTII